MVMLIAVAAAQAFASLTGAIAVSDADESE
jgi:hypothetical protein